MNNREVEEVLRIIALAESKYRAATPSKFPLISRIPPAVGAGGTITLFVAVGNDK